MPEIKKDDLFFIDNPFGGFLINFFILILGKSCFPFTPDRDTFHNFSK